MFAGKKVVFPDFFCFAPWILSLPRVTPAAGTKMYFVTGRPGILYQESWTLSESPLTSLCSEGTGTPLLLPQCCPWCTGAGLQNGPPKVLDAAFFITPSLPCLALVHLRLWSVVLGQGWVHNCSWQEGVVLVKLS